MKSVYAKPSGPAERDPGPGWLRSRFMHACWPRPSVAPCGRPICPCAARRRSGASRLHGEPNADDGAFAAGYRAGADCAASIIEMLHSVEQSMKP